MNKLIKISLITALSALSSGCADADAEQERDSTGQRSEVAPHSGRANTAGTDGAQDTPTRTVSDTDRYWIDQAAKACKNREFKSVFEAFVRSQAVRDLYTADPIQIWTNEVSRKSPRARYFDFPIAMSDYSFISKNSEGTPAVEHLRLTFNQNQSDIYRVDWVRVRYGELDNEKEGEAEITETFGLPGYLIFEPTEKCWELVADGTYDGRNEDNVVN